MKQRNYLKLVIDSQKRVLGENKPITEADENLLEFLKCFYGLLLGERFDMPKEDLKIVIDGLEYLVSVLENNEIADCLKEFVDGFLRDIKFTVDIYKEEYELDDVTREEIHKEVLKGFGLDNPLKGVDLDNPFKGFGETH